MSCWKDQDQPAQKKRKCRGGELIVQIDTAVVLHSIHLDIVYIFSCSSCEHFVTQNHATFPQGCFSPSSIYTYTFFIFYLFFFAFDRKFPLLLYTSRGQSSLSLQVEEKKPPSYTHRTRLGGYFSSSSYFVCVAVRFIQFSVSFRLFIRVLCA